MRLRCWGTRGNLATPSAEMLGLGGNTSCYEVQLNDRASILLDCGTGLIEVAEAVMARALRAPHTFHMIVSHFHWDHLLGFPFFHPIHAPGTEVHLYSAFAASELERSIRALFDGTYSPLRDIANLKAKLHFHHIGPEGLELLGARVRCAMAQHSDPCFATRIDFEGRSLCYATDHEAVPSEGNRNVLDLAQGVDLLLHDAQYTEREHAEHLGWGHSSIEAAIANGRAAGAEKLLLTHHDPQHTDAFLSSYVTGLALPDVQLAAEGALIAV